MPKAAGFRQASVSFLPIMLSMHNLLQDLFPRTSQKPDLFPPLIIRRTSLIFNYFFTWSFPTAL